MKQDAPDPSTIRLAVDARAAYQTGVGVYIRNLLNHLYAFIDDSWHVSVLVMKQDAVRIHEEFPHYAIDICDYRWHSVGEQIGFATHLQQRKYDLVHFTYFSYPLAYRGPFISTIHDLTPLTYKTGKASTLHPILYDVKHRALGWVLTGAIERSSMVIVPTQTVKAEICRHWGDMYKDKIQVTYEGLDYRFAQAEAKNINGISFPKKYMLYVGNFYPHKNVQTLLQSLKHVDDHLVLIGPRDVFSSALERFAREHGLGSRVQFVHNAQTSDLKYAYKHASVLVHPALSEGFGLTILEALSLDCPVAASSIPVFYELYDGAFVPFDPRDPLSIARASQQAKASAQSDKLKHILARYSFEQMAKQTAEGYNEVVSSK